jgi:hypothetical protein
LSATERSRIAYEILAYLARNPDAQDTVEGIAEWWLLAQRIEREIGKVEEALTELVTKDLIVERKGKDSRVYYRLNKRRAEEISRLLEHKGVKVSNN